MLNPAFTPVCPSLYPQVVVFVNNRVKINKDISEQHRLVKSTWVHTAQLRHRARFPRDRAAFTFCTVVPQQLASLIST